MFQLWIITNITMVMLQQEKKTFSAFGLYILVDYSIRKHIFLRLLLPRQNRIWTSGLSFIEASYLFTLRSDAIRNAIYFSVSVYEWTATRAQTYTNEPNANVYRSSNMRKCNTSNAVDSVVSISGYSLDLFIYFFSRVAPMVKHIIME